MPRAKVQGPKILTAVQFKQKVEANLHRINNAIETLYGEVNKLAALAEDQMSAIDEVTPGDILKNRKIARQWDVANDVNEWAEAIDELMNDEKLNTSNIIVKLRRAA